MCFVFSPAEDRKFTTLLITQPFGSPSFSESKRPLNASDSSKYLNIFTGIRLRSYDSPLGRVIQSQSVQHRQRRQCSSSPQHAQEGQKSEIWYTCTGVFDSAFEAREYTERYKSNLKASVRNVKDAS